MYFCIFPLWTKYKGIMTTTLRLVIVIKHGPDRIIGQIQYHLKYSLVEIVTVFRVFPVCFSV